MIIFAFQVNIFDVKIFSPSSFWTHSATHRFSLLFQPLICTIICDCFMHFMPINAAWWLICIFLHFYHSSISSDIWTYFFFSRRLQHFFCAYFWFTEHFIHCVISEMVCTKTVVHRENPRFIHVGILSLYTGKIRALSADFVSVPSLCSYAYYLLIIWRHGGNNFFKHFLRKVIPSAQKKTSNVPTH